MKKVIQRLYEAYMHLIQIVYKTSQLTQRLYKNTRLIKQSLYSVYTKLIQNLYKTCIKLIHSFLRSLYKGYAKLIFPFLGGARDFPGPCQHHTRTTPCRDHTQHLYHNHPETVPAPYQNRAINPPKPHQSHTQAVPTRCQTNAI
jgi:hypothetical protein